MSPRKIPQRYLYTVHEESGIPSTRTTCKKAKLVLAAHYRADFVTECMKKNTNITRWLSFSFFGRKWMSVFVSFSAVREFHFRRHFRLRPKMKNAFRSASSVHHKNILVVRCKVLVLVLNTRLGLGLERILKSWSWSWTFGIGLALGLEEKVLQFFGL